MQEIFAYVIFEIHGEKQNGMDNGQINLNVRQKRLGNSVNF